MATTIFDVPYKDPQTNSLGESIMVHDLSKPPQESTTQVPVPQFLAKELPLYLTPLSNNVKTETIIACPTTPSKANFIAVINQLPAFTVAPIQIPTFKAVSAGADPITYYIELLDIGAGDYGVGETQLTADNIKITSFASTPLRGFSFARLNIFKHHLNTDVSKIDTLEINDVAAGWITQTLFMPFGQFLGGDPTDEANWDGSPFTFI
jgi:hypothetical protein